MMKAKDVIKHMKEYNPEDELLVMWWDANVLTYPNDIVSNQEWNKIIDRTDGYGFDEINNDIYEILEETLFDIRKEHCNKKENSSIFNEMIKYVYGKNPIELREHCDKGEIK